MVLMLYHSLAFEKRDDGKALGTAGRPCKLEPYHGCCHWVDSTSKREVASWFPRHGGNSRSFREEGSISSAWCPVARQDLCHG
ncbi:uncharacterized protein [Physcomitrium patens]|uniref:uncharacterized protein isoform X2 n=1 Tax=Physcomitrium patens TaxID=3218 RepID=UPI003CCE1AD9